MDPKPAGQVSIQVAGLHGGLAVALGHYSNYYTAYRGADFGKKNNSALFVTPSRIIFAHYVQVRNEPLQNGCCWDLRDTI